jgi:hypothetical protein
LTQKARKLCDGADEPVRSRCVPMLGNRYGSLVVEALACYAPRCWKCRCDCGRVTVVEGGNLRRKKGCTKSCGRCGRGDGVPRYSELRKAKGEASNAGTV